MKDMQTYILTPPSKRIYAAGVHSTSGEVRDAEHLCEGDGRTAKLVYPPGGEKPVVLLDLGPSAPGGYPIVKVAAQSGNPVLRIAYADWYEWISDPVHGENGDFSRGSCTYLGVELPVPPANPYRYELYTIHGADTYVAAMIQGQQRWVLLQLDTEGSVEIEFFAIENVSDMSPYRGSFQCSDEDLTRLWYASTYTAQIASFPNVDAWTVVEGWLIPRRLAKGNDIGLSVAGEGWTDYRFRFDFAIRRNPGPVSAVGWVVRARDENNGYVGQIDLDSRLHLYKRIDGVYVRLKPAAELPVAIVDGVAYSLEVRLDGERMETYLDGRLIDSTVDSAYAAGKVGFCQPLDKWALIRNVCVESRDGGEILFADDFSGDLGGWSFARTASFIADGAKRDRLPWLGDLDWAGRNVYYAFDEYRYMKDTIRMFAFHQTPEGYIWAACYPENRVKPGIGEYGYYQSDEFSAWFAPVLADYVLFTGDLEVARELYPVVRLGLDYLWNYVEGDGLFFQRYETSKGIWGHILERTGKGAYVNLLVYDALMEGAFLARQLGLEPDAAEYESKASVMREGIQRHLWSDEQQGYVELKGSREFNFYANALALAIGFPDERQAETIAERLRETDMGKYQSLAIRGKFHYRYDSDAIGRIREPGGGVDWIGALHDWRGPHATWECMVYPPQGLPAGKYWGDSSHPDTAMAHLLSGYLLGIQPTAPGFRTYEAVPHPCDLQWAEGRVPTPRGEIRFSWRKTDTAFTARLESPEGTSAVVGIPKIAAGASTMISLNGKPVYGPIETPAGEAEIGAIAIDEDAHYVYLRGLKPGSYDIVRT